MTSEKQNRIKPDDMDITYSDDYSQNFGAIYHITFLKSFSTLDQAHEFGNKFKTQTIFDAEIIQRLNQEINNQKMLINDLDQIKHDPKFILYENLLMRLEQILDGKI